ncbi:major capsid protein [Rhodococcus sp. 06-156-3C]|uniref:phage major capsid protein n=1 Tax=Nocardiaceae TaxID=85025 RepID=UPI000689BE39|nr:MULTISPECIES: phage major capsid protein [Rhodococcus]OZD07691.1 major capsid protein [Rhodococcus sp. 06-156-4C]OZD17096.1 major capsid protein [Rhodococcus sp. 06-156-3C]OZD18434.1 major capsid protein [Rhodococcus sp. 06-156-4a]OZD28365.1 major capsid protein [Rhodococcus sp. 06-156-3]OZD29866.1 major capsid protein [Rhodococcus sp. 06-156-3b]
MGPQSKLKAALERVAELKKHQGDFSAEQIKEITKLDTDIKSYRAAIAANDDTQNALKNIASQPNEGDGSDLPDDPGDFGAAGGVNGGRVLSLKSAGFARKIAAGMMTPSGVSGRKAITSSGESVGAVQVATSPVALGKRAAGLLDLIPVIANSPSRFEYLRQTLREMNAAPIAPGTTKPTSKFAFEPVKGDLTVVAHLSDPIDHYLLQDLAGLEQFVGSELIYGLEIALEAQLLSGDGTGQNFEGILATAGRREQAFAGDRITTTRKAITQLESEGLTPTGFCFSPADWEAIELTRAPGSGQLEMIDSPVDRAARRLHGVPVAVSAGLTDGQGVLLSAGSVALRTDAGVAVRWSENVSDDFSKNQVRARAELRAAPQIARPDGVVVIETEETTG